VSLYWFTNTQATAGRYHFEEAHAQAEPTINPSRTGVAVFADDFKSIRAPAARDNSNIVYWSDYPDGGHYAAMERPQVLVEDLRTFFHRTE
jgi:hypothetical protein